MNAVHDVLILIVALVFGFFALCGAMVAEEERRTSYFGWALGIMVTAILLARFA